MATEIKSPVMNGANGTKTARARSNRDWWPNQLNLEILHQNSPLSNPMGAQFNYAEEFKKVDLAALKKDVEAGLRWSPDVDETDIAVKVNGGEVTCGPTRRSPILG